MSISKRMKLELAQRLLQADFLNEREKDVLKLRLGIENNPPSTLQEIGEKYGITRERVRQIGVAIARKVKKNLPEYKIFANQIFSKSWEPKYLAKEKYLIRRRAAIKRNRTLVRNKCMRLSGYIEEYAITKAGKEKIQPLFKELRIKYRKNKSLFEPDVVLQVKNLRLRWKEVRKKKTPPDQQTPPEQPMPPESII